ncbi:hypothetical protein [Stenotrophomonas rhizophila]|uniref:hypothetical protein n=1 Tax=Stenotrophomonas rhizophila TaxID=216778 RepID=UPI00112F64CB|nr:hypothetical protein [Stenotrophomonas rhizophila]
MTSIHAQTVFDAATARQKAAEAEQLAADVAEFERKGGKVQRLGNTPIDRSGISRRQVVEGGADRRKAAKAGKP